MNEHQLIELQTQFAGAIRDPKGITAPSDVPDERMAVYRELFFGNVRSGLESVFPVAVEILDQDTWLALVGRFWRDHQSTTPEYPRLAREFLTWFETSELDGEGGGNDAGVDIPPWLFELMVWEHAELEVMLELDDQPSDRPEALASRDVMSTVPRLTRSLRVFAFEFPVHRISAEYLPTGFEPTFLASYRTPQDQVDFIELTAPSAALMNELVSVSSRTGAAHVAVLAEQMGLPVDAIESFAREFLQDLLARQIIIRLDNN